MLINFQVDGIEHSAEWLEADKLFTDYEPLARMIEMIIDLKFDVPTSVTGSYAPASLETPLLAFGTVLRAAEDLPEITNITTDEPLPAWDEEEQEEDNAIEKRRTIARWLLEKGRFASRSEAGRYAANIRWQNNQKEEDDPQKRTANLRKRAEDLANRLRELELQNPLYHFPQRNVTANDLDEAGNPMLGADGQPKTVTTVTYSEELMKLHDDIVSFGADIETEVMRRAGGDVEAVIATQEQEINAELGELQKKQDDLSLMRSFLAYGSQRWLEANGARVDEVLAKYCTPEEATFLKDPKSRSAFQFAYSAEAKDIRKQVLSILKKKFNANKDVIDTDLALRFARLQQRKNDLSVLSAVTDITREVLGEMVPIGGVAPEVGNGGKLVNAFKSDVQSIFPDALVTRVNYDNKFSDVGKLTVKSTKYGGSFSLLDRTVKTSGERSTNVHEFMHNVTYADPFFRFMETAVLDSRRFGAYERPESLKPFEERVAVGAQGGFYSVGLQMPAGGYFRDSFVDTYAGRVYSHGARETLTRGVEALVTGNPSDVGLWRATAGAIIVGATRNMLLTQKATTPSGYATNTQGREQ